MIFYLVVQDAAEIIKNFNKIEDPGFEWSKDRSAQMIFFLNKIIFSIKIGCFECRAKPGIPFLAFGLDESNNYPYYTLIY